MFLLYRYFMNLSIFFNIDTKKSRFLIIGFVNTVFGLIFFPCLYLLTAPLGLHYIAILIISHTVCVTFSFLTTKFLVFRTLNNAFNEFLKFFIFHLLILSINLTALPALVEFVGLKPILAQFIFSIFIIISSYFWHSYVTFSKSK